MQILPFKCYGLKPLIIDKDFDFFLNCQPKSICSLAPFCTLIRSSSDICLNDIKILISSAAVCACVRNV